jgi:riboflavin kinase/FMN adenylyltransferase
VVQPFSRAFSETPAQDFLQNLLWPKLSPRCLIVGYDFSFGVQRTGSADLMRTFAAAHAATVEVVPAVLMDGTPISSQRIRACLSKGMVEDAAALLGRPFELEGIVTRGDGRGRQLGFPTANLSAREQMVPATGVYITQLILKSKVYSAVTNIGFAPTATRGRPVPIVETHLLNHQLDLYGCSVRVRFLKKLREEKKFSSLEELKVAIRHDVATAEGFFDEMG